MSGKSPGERGSRAGPAADRALVAILLFAPIVAALCWAAAWMFRDEFVFKATLIGLGCFTIVIAVVACLLVLLRRRDNSHDDKTG